MDEWRPGADAFALRARAELLQDIRGFFDARGVLEVETPLLCTAGVTDPAVEPFEVSTDSGTRFLQTSPEYAMKRLLAAGSGDIYQLCKGFRAGEVGARHNPEYTLLEWYRLGFDLPSLVREVAELVCQILARCSWQVWPWGKLFQHLLGIDAHRLTEAELRSIADRNIRGELPELDRDGLLDLLMSHCVEPGIADWGVVFVTDYPASQASLAKKTTMNGVEVGARFECYVDGIELANGYWECADAAELRARFEADNRLRARRGQAIRPIDEYLLAALRTGMPDCSGVALGVDRLLALQTGSAALSDTLSFDWLRS